MQKPQLRIRSLKLGLRLTAAPLMHQAYTTVQSSHSLHRVALAKSGQWCNCRPIRLMAHAVNKRARSASKRIPPPDAQVTSLLGASDQQPGTDIISLLQLQPHPEGGFYKRT